MISFLNRWQTYARLSKNLPVIPVVPRRTKQKQIMQEIFHLLGRIPEHLRQDRNAYVTILWENILEGKSFRMFSCLIYTYMYLILGMSKLILA